MKGYGGNLNKTYLKANMLAAEAVSNIRTVAAFCSEEKIVSLYSEELKEPSKSSFRRGQAAGLFYGVSQFFLFSSYALALWYICTYHLRSMSCLHLLSDRSEFRAQFIRI